MQLHDLRPQPGATHHDKRVGRGTGSGHGKTSGKGTKGQKARRRGEFTPKFEGGQTPFLERLPLRRGFRNTLFQKRYTVVNFDILERLDDGATVTLDSLAALRLIKPRFAGTGPFMGLKVLGDGTLTKRLIVEASKVSKAARARIEELGGTVNELDRAAPDATTEPDQG